MRDEWVQTSPSSHGWKLSKVPESVMAKVRGAGANVFNTERPASWSANRTRPLCTSEAGTHNGPGDVESASSFRCK